MRDIDTVLENEMWPRSRFEISITETRPVFDNSIDDLNLIDVTAPAEEQKVWRQEVKIKISFY